MSDKLEGLREALAMCYQDIGGIVCVTDEMLHKRINELEQQQGGAAKGETPRTDGMSKMFRDAYPMSNADGAFQEMILFASQLERELAEAQRELAGLGKDYEKLLRESQAMERDRDARAREACSFEKRTTCSFAVSASAEPEAEALKIILNEIAEVVGIETPYRELPDAVRALAARSSTTEPVSWVLRGVGGTVAHFSKADGWSVEIVATAPRSAIAAREKM